MAGPQKQSVYRPLFNCSIANASQVRTLIWETASRCGVLYGPQQLSTKTGAANESGAVPSTTSDRGIACIEAVLNMASQPSLKAAGPAARMNWGNQQLLIKDL